MSYIGSVPVTGKFQKLDNISAQFNGVTTTFNLTQNGVAVKPGTAMNLLISMNGVLQEPGVAYQVSMTQIIFPEAPLATETFFGVLLGAAGTSLAPQDGSVSTATLGDGSVTEIKLADGQVTNTKLAAGVLAFSNITSKPTTLSGYGITDSATLNANSFAGTQTGNDNKLLQWKLQDTSLVVVDAGTVASGTVTLDYTTGSSRRVQVGGAITLAFSNFAPTGNQSTVFLELVNGGSATVTWPTVQWVKKDGTFTTTMSTYLSDFGRAALQSSGTDFFVFWTRDGGTTVYGKLL